MTISYLSQQRLRLNNNIVKKLLVSFLTFFVFANLTSAQEVDSTGDPGDNPEWQMDMGREAYGVENYNEALEHFKKAIGLYGQTNLEIQYYVSKSYYGLNALENAKEEINLFFNLGPDSSYVYFKEMAALRDEVSNTIKEEEEDYQRAKNSTTIILLDAYIQKHPNGKHIDEIKNKKLTLAEDKAYQRAKNINDINIYKQFLQDYPDSKYTEEAMQALDALDEAAYEKAITTNTEIALRTYINNAVDFNRKIEAEAKLNLLLETEIYNKAIKDNTVPAFKNYLKLYPDTEHAKEVKKLLAERLLKLARDAEKDNKYDVALDYYNDYLTNFPNAEDKADVESKKAKALRKVELDQTARRAYVTYNVGMYNPSPADIGLRFGSLTPRGSGGFVGFRFNTKVQLSPEFDHSDDTTSGSLVKNNDYTLTDNKRVGRFEFMLGFNRRIIKPLWVYAAFGLGYQQVLYEVEIRKVDQPARKSWSVHSGESKPGYLWEFGLTANVLKALTVNAGISSFNSQKFYPTFGIGFSWKAKDQSR